MCENNNDKHFEVSKQEETTMKFSLPPYCPFSWMISQVRRVYLNVIPLNLVCFHIVK